MEYILLFIFGSILGSFYLVVATRMPENESIISPGSHCNLCKHPLAWYDLIPVLSYLSTFGHCRYCKKKITPLYLIVELCTGLSFMLAYKLYGISYEFFAAIIIFSLAILIFISDFKYYIILDSPLVISAVAIFSLKLYYFGFKASIMAVLSGIILFVVLYLIKLFGDFLFKQESLGGGDIKLAFVIGIILGVRLSLVSFILSSFLALPYALTSMYITKKKEVPFGPFIIFAAVIVFIYMAKFSNLLNYFLFI